MDQSFGIIPLRKNDHFQVLLVKNKNGNFWGFPKGHPNIGEDELTAATREFKEETNLDIEHLLSKRGFSETYSYTKHEKLIHKKVKYFPALVKGDLKIQKHEILEANWFDLKNALQKLTFKEAKEVCEELIKFLDKLSYL